MESQGPEGGKKKSARGGARAGAGRKPGSGAFGEKTVPMRIPVSLAQEVERELQRRRDEIAKGKGLARDARPIQWKPLGIPAAGKEPGDPEWLDLGREMAPSAASSWAMRMPEDWEEEGLRQRDWAIVDRAAKLREGDLVAALREGAPVAARLERDGERWILRGPGGAALAEAPSPEDLGAWGTIVSLARRLS